MKKNIILFIALALLTFTLGFLSNLILKSEEVIVNSLAEYLTSEQIREALEIKAKWNWVGYISISVVLLLKISIIALIIDFALFFYDVKVKYGKLFSIVLTSEFVFLSVIILKTIWFYFFKSDYTLEDLQYFFPLSAINITGYDNLEAWFIYPLQTINLIEVSYWVSLSYLIGKELKIKIYRSFSMVASSYGVALLIWIGCVMFFSLSMN